MRRPSWFTAVAVLVLAAGLYAQEPLPQPYHDGGNGMRSYNGPGREDPEPGGLKEVRIAYFGPADSGHSEGDLMWEGANLAVEEANRHGGYRGLPFRLVPAWADNPWAGGAASLIRVAYGDQAWAIIGGIDGATTHLAEQVVAKAQLTLINPAATDSSIHGANVPWIFSCVPGDHAVAPLISQRLRESATPFALISSTGHDARVLATELRKALGRDHLSPLMHMEVDTPALSAATVAKRVLASDAKALVVLANAHDSYMLIREVRQAGFGGLVIAGPWLASAVPVSHLEGVLIPVLGDVPAEFRQQFSARYGRQPDYVAAHGFDAANLLIAAIRQAGLNRTRIRDAVQALSPYEGITGRIEWDRLGQNQRPVQLRSLSASHPAQQAPAAREAK